ncbi:glycosyltransferase [Corynebacterium hadale]|nr:glycosyltransferase [Corynebacterium hadale]MCG7255601.1 glycosyltransferase [Corynebacterium hadale]MCG7264822.1 glycosyltransferase [Corynebacterium hadale]
MATSDIAIVENGVDPIPDALPVVPDDGKVHVVTLSLLVPHKRIEHAIDAIAGRKDVVLDIIGSGWWEDRLREYAAGRAEICFHGHVNDAYKHALLSRASLHLMPSEGGVGHRGRGGGSARRADYRLP